jgi:hypothetical protein
MRALLLILRRREREPQGAKFSREGTGHGDEVSAGKETNMDDAAVD